MIKDYIKNRLNTHLLNNKKIVGGVLVKCMSTDRVLLLLRNDPKPIWSMVTGKIEEDEELLEGLKREFVEELSMSPNLVKFNFIRTEVDKNVIFNYYEGFCEKEFKPILDYENITYGWFDIDNLPKPLYKGLFDKIKNI